MVSSIRGLTQVAERIGSAARGLAEALGIDGQELLYDAVRALALVVFAWLTYRVLRWVTGRLQRRSHRMATTSGVNEPRHSWVS